MLSTQAVQKIEHQSPWLTGGRGQFTTQLGVQQGAPLRKDFVRLNVSSAFI
jgi:hypothetical protein